MAIGGVLTVDWHGRQAASVESKVVMAYRLVTHQIHTTVPCMLYVMDVLEAVVPITGGNGHYILCM